MTLTFRDGAVDVASNTSGYHVVRGPAPLSLPGGRAAVEDRAAS
jgi:hypothetical protein